MIFIFVLGCIIGYWSDILFYFWKDVKRNGKNKRKS